MNKSILSLLLTLFVASLHAQTFDVLVWADEFAVDGPLDTAKWWQQHQLPNGTSWYNGEIQHYTNRDTNAYIQGGSLHLSAYKETFTDQGQTKDYTSARLNSKFAFTYGRVEIRAQLPTGTGTWPALWMLGQNITEPGAYWQTQGYATQPWPQCGEIDIMEHVSNEYMTHGAVHWENNGHTYIGNGYNTDPTQYHVYGIIWEENLIRWYVDGVQFYQFSVQASNNSDDAFRHPMFLLLNLAVGGNWPGYPDATTPFPSSMLVDYVRVYQPAVASTVADAEKLILSVYPNPAMQELTVESSVVLEECIILDAAGKKVMTVNITDNKTRIDVESLAAGTYTLECNAKAQRFTKTFVKQ
jgi:beta-glucanase (GH16 family)